MSSEIPPTYYFNGISFNPDFYQSSSDDYLTATTGKKIFLSYPFAQGTESISKIFSSNIDSLTPTSTFSFLDSQTSGDINLCNSQTSGVLNIGTGARTTAGIINIGTGSTLANPFAGVSNAPTVVTGSNS
jgi:hypothetical protein